MLQLDTRDPPVQCRATGEPFIGVASVAGSISDFHQDEAKPMAMECQRAAEFGGLTNHRNGCRSKTAVRPLMRRSSSGRPTNSPWCNTYSLPLRIAAIVRGLRRPCMIAITPRGFLSGA